MKKIIACLLTLILFVGCSTSNNDEKISFKVNDDYTNFSVTLDEFETLLNAYLSELIDGYSEKSFSSVATDEYSELRVDDTTVVEAFFDDNNVVEYIRVHGFGEADTVIGERVANVAGTIIGMSDDEFDHDNLSDNAFNMYDNCTRIDQTEAYGSAVQDHYMMSVDYIETGEYCNFSIWIRPSEFENNEDYLASTDYSTTYGAYCTSITEENEEEISEEEQSSQPTQQQPRTYWGEGMYKVGVDIPAGEYNVIAEEGESAYLDLSSDSTGNSRILNNVFENNMYITVEDGQYLTLKRCYISLE